MDNTNQNPTDNSSVGPNVSAQPVTTASPQNTVTPNQVVTPAAQSAPSMAPASATTPGANSTPSPNESLPNSTVSNQNSTQTSTQPTPPPITDVNEKLWGAISYIPMLALLALLVKPDSAYIRLHGRQGLLIFGLFFISLFLYVILIPLGPILAGLSQIALFVIGLYSAVMAFMGNWWKIPILGDIAESIPVEIFTKTATQALTGQLPSTSDQNTSNDTKPSQNGTAQ